MVAEGGFLLNWNSQIFKIGEEGYYVTEKRLFALQNAFIGFKVSINQTSVFLVQNAREKIIGNCFQEKELNKTTFKTSIILYNLGSNWLIARRNFNNTL